MGRASVCSSTIGLSSMIRWRMAEPKDSHPFFSQIDALRALAVMAVMWSHWMPHDWQGRLPWGQYGVQLFFVISGFLITGILVRARESLGSTRQILYAFFARRALRIVPVYYVLLLVLVLANFSNTRTSITWHLAFGTNWWMVWFNSYDSWLVHFWSLAVEEQFYILWPLVVLCCPTGWLRPICYGLIAIAWASRCYFALTWPEQITDVLLPANLDALASGALLALAPYGSARNSNEQIHPHLVRAALAIFVVTQALVLIQFEHVLESIRRTCMVICFGWLVWQTACGIGGPLGAVLSFKPLRALGQISYAMYLLHNLMVPAFNNLTPWLSPEIAQALHASPIGRAAAMFSCTIILASVSWYGLERPILKLKSYFEYPGQSDCKRCVSPLPAQLGELESSR